MGLQDRDYMQKRNQIQNLKNKNLKEFISEITVGNLIIIIIGFTILLITWKTIESKIEENQLNNIANNAKRILDEEIEKDNKKMLEFVENSNKEMTNDLLKFNQAIINASKFEPIRKQSITPTPTITYAPITQKQTTRSEICTTNIDTKEKKCKFIN